MKRKIILIAAALAFTACGVGKLKEDGNAFMEAWKAGDTAKSFGMMHESLQKEVGGAEGWATMSAGFKPVSWSFSGFNVNANGEGKLDGSAEGADGKKGDLELKFFKVGDVNKVLGFNFKPTPK